MNKNDYWEHVSHGTPAFSIAVYNNHYDKNSKNLFYLHYHREFEFLLITEGHVRLWIDNDIMYLNKGEGVFINSGILHSAMQAEECPCGFTAVVFSPEFIAHQSEEIYTKYVSLLINGSLAVPTRLNRDITCIISDIAECWARQKFGYELLIKSSVIHMSALCLSQAEYKQHVKKDNKVLITKKLLDYIHENYKEKITLDDLSACAHICGAHLCRIFKEVSGLSPFVYLNRYRVSQAVDMLLGTDKSIAEIAQSCGYNSSSYFNKTFLRFMDCTPMQYRKKCL